MLGRSQLLVKFHGLGGCSIAGYGGEEWLFTVAEKSK